MPGQMNNIIEKETMIGLHYAGPQEYEKAAGNLNFVTDIEFENMAHVVAFRSTIPHGMLLHLNVEEAKAAPGVIAVLTAKDVPGSKEYGYIYKDTPILAYDRIHCVGEPIALVVAESREEAEAACELIQWEYEELPGIFSFEQALDDTYPPIHNDTNLLKHNVLHKGTVFDGGVYRVRSSISTQRVAHMYLEPECSIALYQDGEITVYTASQDIFTDRSQLCEALLLGENDVRVIQAPTGGGFGGKLDITTEIIAALSAYKIHRPVKALFDRNTSMHVVPKRHPMQFDLELAADAEGRIIYLTGKAYSDTGAFASSGDKVLRKALANITGPYFVPNLHIDGYTVYTNNPLAGAMRGFGQCQSSFAFEVLMDMLSQEMGVDVEELRKRNLLKPGDANGVGIVVSDDIRPESTREALMKYLSENPIEFEENGKAYGIGFANTMFAAGLGFGRPDQARVRLELDADGGFTLFCGSADIGQGSISTYAMICADALKIHGDRVRVKNGDTKLTPPAGPTTATRLTVMVGNAILDAASNMKRLIATAAAEYFKTEGNVAVTLLEEGLLLNDQNIAYDALVGFCVKNAISLSCEGFYDSTSSPEDPESLQGPVFNCYIWGSQAVELAVDTDTGEIDVLRAIAAFDVGRAIDRERVSGQIEGGVSMALGMALKEDMQVRAGRVKANSFSTYLIPTAQDMPNIISIIVETGDKAGPYGAKGIGEPPTQGVAAACANAVYNAIGVRINQLPITPESVLSAIRASREGNKT